MKKKRILLRVLLGLAIALLVTFFFSLVYISIKQACLRKVKERITIDFNQDIPVNLSFDHIGWGVDFYNLNQNGIYISFKHEEKPICVKDKSGNSIKIIVIHTAYGFSNRKASACYGYADATEEEYNSAVSTNSALSGAKP